MGNKGRLKLWEHKAFRLCHFMSYYSSHLGTIVIYWASMCYRNINMKKCSRTRVRTTGKEENVTIVDSDDKSWTEAEICIMLLCLYRFHLAYTDFI